MMRPFCVRLDPALKALWPEIRLGCLSYAAVPQAENPALWAFFGAHVLPALRDALENTPLANLPNLGEARQAFRAFGRDPGRSRVSSEALYRRLRQGKELYRINSVVDVNNLISLETGFSLGSYDQDRLTGDLNLRLGRAGEVYAGIGKDTLNLENMPLLADEQGPFGGPCSDSRRAMISLESRNIFTVIYSFSGQARLEETMVLAQKRLTSFAGAANCAAFMVC